MIAYNKKYFVYVVGTGIVTTTVVQTIYTAVTGLPMAATLPGLIASILILVVSTGVAYLFFNRKSGNTYQAAIEAYDELCDPSASAEMFKPHLNELAPPYDGAVSWLMSYYAQILLDLGRVQEAQEIERNMYDSIKETDKIDEQAKIIVNLVPLAQKLLGHADAVPIIQKGLELLQAAPKTNEITSFEAYLNNQLVLSSAHANQDDEKLVRFYSSARNNSSVPLRLRVEQAWAEAQIHYKNGETAREIECLEFIENSGNQLAVVKPAHDRLIALS